MSDCGESNHHIFLEMFSFLGFTQLNLSCRLMLTEACIKLQLSFKDILFQKLKGRLSFKFSLNVVDEVKNKRLNVLLI